jgi:hypothetical protein
MTMNNGYDWYRNNRTDLIRLTSARAQQQYRRNKIVKALVFWAMAAFYLTACMLVGYAIGQI